MSKSEETKWTKKICGILKKQTSVKIVPLVASGRSEHGISDRLFVHAEWIGLVEFKGIDTKLSNPQVMFGRQCNVVRLHSAFIWRRVESSDLMVSLETFEGEVLLVDNCYQVLQAMIRLSNDSFSSWARSLV